MARHNRKKLSPPPKVVNRQNIKTAKKVEANPKPVWLSPGEIIEFNISDPSNQRPSKTIRVKAAGFIRLEHGERLKLGALEVTKVEDSPYKTKLTLELNKTAQVAQSFRPIQPRPPSQLEPGSESPIQQEDSTQLYNSQLARAEPIQKGSIQTELFQPICPFPVGFNQTEFIQSLQSDPVQSELARLVKEEQPVLPAWTVSLDVPKIIFENEDPSEDCPEVEQAFLPSLEDNFVDDFLKEFGIHPFDGIHHDDDDRINFEEFDTQEFDAEKSQVSFSDSEDGAFSLSNIISITEVPLEDPFLFMTDQSKFLPIEVIRSSYDPGPALDYINKILDS